MFTQMDDVPDHENMGGGWPPRVPGDPFPWPGFLLILVICLGPFVWQVIFGF